VGGSRSQDGAVILAAAEMVGQGEWYHGSEADNERRPDLAPRAWADLIPIREVDIPARQDQRGPRESKVGRSWAQLLQRWSPTCAPSPAPPTGLDLREKRCSP
jgi:hypothetical protein